MSRLITNPTFTFPQGDVYDGAELPITVVYYNGMNDDLEIELRQNEDVIQITSLGYLKQLVKDVEKHYSQAKTKLDGKS